MVLIPRQFGDDWSPLAGMQGPFSRGDGVSAYLPPTPNDYDGVNDYQTRGADLTGVADSKVGTFAAFLRVDGGDGASRRILNHIGNDFFAEWDTTNRFRIFARNAAGTTILTIRSNTAYLAGASWISVLASWDLANTTGQVYVNDASDLLAGATLTNDTLDYAGGTDWGFGAYPTGSAFWNGCLSIVWVDFANFTDFSVEANRRKFITAENKPVNLGATGSNPGSTPIIYTDNGDLTDNKGTGGDFTTTGSLDACSSNPGA